MTVQPLLSIGAFARAVELAPSALRYYDECGLLAPAEVDERTGYRYYTPALLRRAHLVRRMREAGVPVEVMRTALEGSADEAADALRAHVTRVARSAQAAATVAEDVLAALRRDEAPAPAPVTAVVDGPMLAAAMSRVAAAADRDPVSPLAVVLLDLTAAGLTVAATNRVWLATWRLPTADLAVSGQRRFAVPRRDVDDLVDWSRRRDRLTLTGEADRELALLLSAGSSSRDVGLVEDRFPAYEALTAQLRPHGRVLADRERLLDVLGRPPCGGVAIDASAEGPVVRLRTGGDRLRVTDHGGTEGVHLDTVTTGAPMELSVRADALAATLGATVGRHVLLEHAGADRVLRVSAPEQHGFGALLMPVA